MITFYLLIAFLWALVIKILATVAKKDLYIGNGEILVISLSWPLTVIELLSDLLLYLLKRIRK